MSLTVLDVLQIARFKLTLKATFGEQASGIRLLAMAILQLENNPDVEAEFEEKENRNG